MAVLLVGSLLGTSAVAGLFVMNGGIMQGHMMDGDMMTGMGGSDCGMDSLNHMHEGMHCDPDHEHNEECEQHEYQECEEYQWSHEHCEEELEEHQEEHEHEERHEEEEHHGCGMMG
jgi:hypothetical protein